MRIISGTARGRRLTTLKGEDTRPTLERVKEGMFSAVQFWLPGARVLDLFAGSGQLGLEALSRGAAHCIFVEANREAADVVRRNVEDLGFREESSLVRADAAAFLARCKDRFDLILLDPPYGSALLPGILGQVAQVAAPGALVLCESGPDVPFPEETGGLRLEKQYRYGTVAVSRYKMAEEE